MLGLEDRHLQDLVALLLAAGEALVEVAVAERGSMPRRFIHSMSDRRTSSTDRSMPLRAESAWRRKLRTLTPGISSGYWKPRNMPGAGPLVGGPAR